jgi:hypothetical protein
MGELHFLGIEGDEVQSNKYGWSIIDAPETEGWNAEYCTAEHGPRICIAGAKNIAGDNEPNDFSNTKLPMKSDKLYVHNRTNDSKIYVLIDHLHLYTKMMSWLLNYLKNIGCMTVISF